MRRWLVTAAALTSLVSALPASANTAIPHISGMLVERKWTTLAELPFVLICGLIQGLIIHRFCKKRSVLQWTGIFTLATLGLSHNAIGPDHSPWFGVLTGFVFTVLLYSVMLPILKLGEQRRWPSYFGLSVLVNAASYGFTALVLFALLDVPTMLQNDRALRREVEGYFVVSESGFNRLLSPPDYRLYHLTSDRLFDETTISVGAMVDSSTGKPRYMTLTGNSESFAPIKLPENISKTLAVSRDGKVLYCNVRDGTVFYDLAKKRIVLRAHRSMADLADGVFSSDNRYFAGIAAGNQLWLVDIDKGKWKSLGVGVFPCFNQESTQLSWVSVDRPFLCSRNSMYPYKGRIITYNLKSAERTSIKFPEGYDSNLAISPDGKMFAYVGYECNPFARRLMMPALIVVSADGTQSVVVRRLGDSFNSFDVQWLPQSARH